MYIAGSLSPAYKGVSHPTCAGIRSYIGRVKTIICDLATLAVKIKQNWICPDIGGSDTDIEFMIL